MRRIKYYTNYTMPNVMLKHIKTVSYSFKGRKQNDRQCHKNSAFPSFNFLLLSGTLNIDTDNKPNGFNL